MSQVTDQESLYYLQVVRRQPVVIVKGEGTKVWDEDGKEYLDFTAGWAVNNLGHCHPVVADAVAEQARTLMQTSNQFYTVPQVKLAKLLVENSCMDRVFVCNSGAEAIEGCIKTARKYGRLNRDGAYEIITALDSFHGRTLAGVSATGQPHYQEAWQPLLPGFVHVPYNDIEAIRKATTDNTCAVMLEPVQGEGGVNVPDEDYLKEVRAWCDANNLLLIFDEIQVGVGRLGTLWGYETFGVEPDVMALAKGLGGGVPIGAFLMKEHAAVLSPGDHGSTFGGNALTCAAAAAVMDYIVENDVVKHAAEMGVLLKQGLEKLRDKLEFVAGVRGKGLLLGLEFVDDMAAAAVAACNEEGLLLNPVRPNILRFMPPLTITPDEIEQGLQRLENGLVKARAPQ
ncbi:MAG: acetylornithine/N-succinyldiaminopimelate aminotransferase [Chloroflexi bacterium]|nr:MAG: acetylornithine/N-succinyldiaminopimelate aminotransferase [Chloroflexota bacterium]